MINRGLKKRFIIYCSDDWLVWATHTKTGEPPYCFILDQHMLILTTQGLRDSVFFHPFWSFVHFLCPSAHKNRFYLYLWLIMASLLTFLHLLLTATQRKQTHYECCARFSQISSILCCNLLVYLFIYF